MFSKGKSLLVMTAVLGLCAIQTLGGTGRIQREIPKPHFSHPGNVFLTGEEVTIPVSAEDGTAWRVLDYDELSLMRGVVQGGRAVIGRLPTGYYELEIDSGPKRIALGVLEPLRAPTPAGSPIAIDVASAWFFPTNCMEQPASLCALAGINWVRDRLLWGELEPKKSEFAKNTRYDASAQVQHEAGLRILQVAHCSPAWANTNTQRFPLDLRDIYNFYKELAGRWDGKVLAFEPWNEADISVFGGHTGSEMASLQKAAYLGLKAGNKKVIGCCNVFAIHRASTLADFNANEAWPYFDSFNLHHYEALPNYPKLYADFRAISAGKPLWVSECSVHVQWSGDEKLKELSREDARFQSQRVAKTYAMALHEGAEMVFYFMLPHYSERNLQFGVLRPDLSPRPAYLSIAAVGRLLANAKRMGKVQTSDDGLQGYVFRAKPDGKDAEVLVIWSKRKQPFELSKAPVACFDHLGRRRAVQGKVLELENAPQFVILAKGSTPALVQPPKLEKALPGEPSNLVLQALLPEQDVVCDKSAYKVAALKTKRISLYLYNFGTKTASGALNVDVPAKWSASLSTQVEIGPGERKQIPFTVSCETPDPWDEATVKISGRFGKDRPVLSLRFIPQIP